MKNSILRLFIGIILSLTFTNSAWAESKRMMALRELISHDLQDAAEIKHSSFTENFDDSDKPVLLIIHGLHESPYFMRHWADFFSKRNFQVVSIRLPGHFSRTGKNLDDVTAEDWIKTANQFFLSLTEGNSKVSILGYSTGGTLATRLALQFPDRVDKLFLISPALSLRPLVQLSSTFLSPLGFSGKKLCKDPESAPCKILKRLDAQAQLMLNDGLDMSPQAGGQVSRLIDLTVNQFRPQKQVELETGNSSYADTVDTLSKIKIPVFIADSESDDVVNVQTNYQWMQQKGQLQNYLLFKKGDGILHALMARGPETSFSTGTLRYNPKIDQIENLFDRAFEK